MISRNATYILKHGSLSCTGLGKFENFRAAFFSTVRSFPGLCRQTQRVHSSLKLLGVSFRPIYIVLPEL